MGRSTPQVLQIIHELRRPLDMYGFSVEREGDTLRVTYWRSPKEGKEVRVQVDDSGYLIQRKRFRWPWDAFDAVRRILT